MWRHLLVFPLTCSALLLTVRGDVITVVRSISCSFGRLKCLVPADIVGGSVSLKLGFGVERLVPFQVCSLPRARCLDLSTQLPVLAACRHSIPPWTPGLWNREPK